MKPPPLVSVGGQPAPRAKSAARAEPNSDLTRPRDFALAAVVGALALAGSVALAPPAGGLRAPGPLARPHREAKLACAACHEADGGATKSCGGCHGAHPSTRAAHRALAASGRMGCTTCHTGHGDARGVAFGEAGAWIAWGPAGERDERSERNEPRARSEGTGTGAHGPPPGTTVPLVPLRACVGCHDLGSPRDPVAACAHHPDPDEVSLCLDEHTRVAEARAVAGPACKRQHAGPRFVAWEATRALAAPPRAGAPEGPARSVLAGGARATTHAPWSWLAVGLAASAMAMGGSRLARRLRRRPAHQTTLAPPATRVRLPVIDTATCLGCYACVDACPFDVLEIQRYVAVVARPNDCCGVVLCQQVCPNGSLQISEGEPITQRPDVDVHLESSTAPGVFLAGDLTGLPLIKNAIHQGRRVVDRIADGLPARDRVRAPRAAEGSAAPLPTAVDLVIIGAGPAGLSASLQAEHLGLSYVTLEQGSVASSIRSFPRNKLVFDQPMQLPLEGELWLREATKEDLLAQWTRIVRARHLAVLEQHRVTDLTRHASPDAKPRFTVTAESASGPVAIEASRVLLAIGRRGTPRLLPATIAAGAETQVSYALADARSFAGQRVLIVGLGDSAMEAALALARQPGTTVTVSYRGADFSRGKARNIAELKGLVTRGRVRLVFGSVVERIDPGSALLRTTTGREPLPIDAVLVLIGGIPSWQLLDRAGVRRTVQLAAPEEPTSGGDTPTPTPAARRNDSSA